MEKLKCGHCLEEKTSARDIGYIENCLGVCFTCMEAHFCEHCLLTEDCLTCGSKYKDKDMGVFACPVCKGPGRVWHFINTNETLTCVRCDYTRKKLVDEVCLLRKPFLTKKG